MLVDREEHGRVRVRDIRCELLAELLHAAHALENEEQEESVQLLLRVHLGWTPEETFDNVWLSNIRNVIEQLR